MPTKKPVKRPAKPAPRKAKPKPEPAPATPYTDQLMENARLRVLNAQKLDALKYVVYCSQGSAFGDPLPRVQAAIEAEEEG